MRARLLAIAVLATLVALLTALDRPGSGAAASPAPRPVGAVIPSGSASASTWYCAAGSAGGDGSATHEVIVSNPTDRRLSVVLTPVVPPATGPDGAPVPTTTTSPPATVRVEPQSSLVTPVPVGASIQVEVAGVGAVVSHRLVVGNSFDESVCATSAAPSAFFPSATTQATEGAVAQLWLFNPFPADASVDVTVSSEDGVRPPGPLQGIVVPGGTAKVIDLGSVLQFRDQFAMAVRARTGVFVAELSQRLAGSSGLVLVPGVQRTARRIALADGRSGGGLAERYVVYNPGADTASVLVGVVPYDADPAVVPEPFDLEVPARRFVVVDLETQARVPADRPHWVHVDALSGDGVVVERVGRVTAKDNPWGVESGAAAATGTAAAARRWVLPWADRAAASTSQLAVANPSTDTIARVTVRRVAGGRSATVEGGTVELGPGRGALVDLGAAGDAPGTLVISASSPVVAERRVAAASGDDVALLPGTGTAGAFSSLPSLERTSAAGLGGD